MHRNGFRKALAVSLTALATLALGLAASAQSSWSNTYGGTADQAFYDAIPLSDGGYLAWGWTRSFGAGDYDGWLLRLGPTGEVVWQRAYGGPGDDTFQTVLPLDDGGFLVAGSTASFGPGAYDAWVLRLDASGNVLGQRAIGGTDEDWAGYCVPSGDGGFLFVGYRDLPGSGNDDLWVFKTDADGHLVWDKAFGGTDNDWANGIVRVSDGFLIPGVSYFDGHYYSGVILKIDASGNVLWQRRYKGSGSYCYIMGLTPLSNGDLFAVGSSDEHGGQSVWLARLDGSGNILWQETLGLATTGYMKNAVETSDGGIVLAGYHYSNPDPSDANVWVAKVDASGALLWQRDYPQQGWDNIQGVHVTGDGGLLLAGRLDGNVRAQAWLIKTASDGTMDSSCNFVAPAGATLWGASTVMSDVSIGALPGAEIEMEGTGAVVTSSASTVVLCASPGPCTLDCTAAVPSGGQTGRGVTFDASAVMEHCQHGATFLWQFGDGATSTQPHVTHAFAAPGSYTWHLAATADGASCAKSGALTIVNPPAVSSLKKVSPPFKIVVMGANFQNGLRVYIEGSEWTNVVWKNPTKLQVKGGTSLKTLFPKGIARTLRFVNPDGGETTTTWSR